LIAEAGESNLLPENGDLTPEPDVGEKKELAKDGNAD
jgi:hypothetical protein